MKQRNFTIIIFFFFSSHGLLGFNIDSLKNELSQTQDNETAVNLLLLIGENFWTQNLDSSIFYWEQAKLISFENKLDSLEAAALLAIGAGYHSKKDFDAALYYYDLALKNKSTQDDWLPFYDIKLNQSRIYRNLEQFDKARECIELSISRVDTSKYLLLTADYHIELGILESEIGNHRIALDHFFISDKILRNKTSNYIAFYKAKLFYSLGKEFYEIDDYEYTVSYLEKALENSTSDIRQMILCLNGIGIGKIELEKFDEALDFFNQALELNQVNPIEVGASRHGIGICLMETGNYSKANNELENAYSIFNEIGDTNNMISTITTIVELKRKNRALKSMKKWIKTKENLIKKTNSKMHETELIADQIKFQIAEKLGLTYEELFIEYIHHRDSIYQENISNQVHELEIIHETRKKDADVVYLKKEQALKETTISKQKVYLIIGGILASALGMISFLLFSKNREKEKINQEKEKINLSLESTNQELEEKNQTIALVTVK